MHNLDSAVLSRFDLKLKFDFLNPFQIVELAQQQAKMLGLPALTAKEITQLQKISNLTLGDFTAIFRQHQFTPNECCLKTILDGLIRPTNSVKNQSRNRFYRSIVSILFQEIREQIQTTDFMIINWWRRGELNPRPKALYKAFYMFSRAYLKILFLARRRTGF